MARHSVLAVALAAVAVATVACSAPPPPTPTLAPTQAPTPTPNPTPAATPTPTPPFSYDRMWEELPEIQGLDWQEADLAAMAALPWIADGISAEEQDAAREVALFAAHNGEVFRALTPKDWLDDGLHRAELDVLLELREMAKKDGALARRIAAMPFWATLEPRSDVATLRELEELARKKPGLLDRAVDHAWIGDGLSPAEHEFVDLLIEVEDDGTEAVVLERLGVLLSAPQIQDGLNSIETELVQRVVAFKTGDAANAAFDLIHAVLDDGWVKRAAWAVVGHRDTRLIDRLMWAGDGAVSTGPAILLRKPWIADGLNDGEYFLLSQWQWSPDDNEELDAIGRIAVQPWVVDGLDEVEKTLLRRTGSSPSEDGVAALGNLQDLPWVADGLNEIERALIDRRRGWSLSEGEALAVVADLLNEPWVQDGVSEVESTLLWALGPLEDGDSAAALSHAVNAFLRAPWADDGLDEGEQFIVGLLSADAVQENSAESVQVAGALSGLPWIQDGISDTERWLARHILSYGPEAAQAVGYADALLNEPWVADGLGDDERFLLGHVADIPADDELGAIRTLLDEPWVADGLGDDESFLLDRATGIPNDEELGAIRTLLDEPWVADGLGDDEKFLLAGLSEIADGEALDAIRILLDEPWAEDGFSELERILIWALGPAQEKGSAIAVSKTLDTLSAQPWVADGLSEDERIVLSALGTQLADVHVINNAVALLERPWAQDGLSEDERFALGRLSPRLGDEEAISTFNSLVREPWFADGLDAREQAMLNLSQLHAGDVDAIRMVLSQPWTPHRPDATPMPTPTPTPTPAPMVLVVAPTSPSSLLVQWSLDADNATSISLLRDGEVVAEPGPRSTSFEDTDLSPNTRYAYRIVVRQRGEEAIVAEDSAATLAHPPQGASIRSISWSGFQFFVLDERNPAHTEYRVQLADGSTSGWSTARCRSFDGFLPREGQQYSITARNLDRVETEPTGRAAGEESGMGSVLTRGYLPNADPWVAARVDDIAAIYGLTEAAADWLSGGIRIEWKRGLPAWAGYLGGGYVGIGHSELGALMHESMHAFWQTWDGWQEPCDQMNHYTFKRDVARFVLDFRAYDRSGQPNPWEPWRPYYKWVSAAGIGDTPEGELFWDVLDEREFYRVPGFYHQQETIYPAHVAGRLSLVPPPLQKYFRGFLGEGESRTWAEEVDWFSRLEEADRHLWGTAFNTHDILNHAPELRAPATASRSRIPEPLRSRLRTADRQRLVDFINTLEDVERTNDSDPNKGSWRNHVKKHLFIAQFYLNELDSSIGVEADQPTLEAVREVLGHLVDLYCGRAFGAVAARDLISNAQELSALQRTSFLKMVDVYARGERITCVGWRP